MEAAVAGGRDARPRGKERRSRERRKASAEPQKRALSCGPPSLADAQGESPLPANRIIDVDGVRLEVVSVEEEQPESGFGGSVSGLRGCRGRVRTGVCETSDLPSMVATRAKGGMAKKNKYKATFV